MRAPGRGGGPLPGQRRRLVPGLPRGRLLGWLRMQRTLRRGPPATRGRPGRQSGAGPGPCCRPRVARPTSSPPPCRAAPPPRTPTRRTGCGRGPAVPRCRCVGRRLPLASGGSTVLAGGPRRRQHGTRQGAPDTTPRLRCRRCPPGRQRRGTVRGFARDWRPARPGGPSEDGREHTAPAPAGPRVLPTLDRPPPGPRALRRAPRHRPFPAPRCRAHEARGVSMAPAARGDAAACSLGAVSPGVGPAPERPAPPHGSPATEGVCLLAPPGPAEARTPEEPDAGTLHGRDSTGGAG